MSYVQSVLLVVGCVVGFFGAFVGTWLLLDVLAAWWDNRKWEKRR